MYHNYDDIPQKTQNEEEKKGLRRILATVNERLNRVSKPWKIIITAATVALFIIVCWEDIFLLILIGLLLAGFEGIFWFFL